MSLFWLDNQLSPAIARWMAERFPDTKAHAIRDLGLADARDLEIFEAAFAAGAIVVSKDADFRELIDSHGDGPQVVWLTCGNTSNARLRTLIEAVWEPLSARLATGARLVEIHDESSLA